MLSRIMLIEYTIDLLIISPLTHLNYMFSKYINLTGVYEREKLDTSQIADITGMLAGCVNLTYLSDISKLDISNVVKMLTPFVNAFLLESIPDI